MLFNLGKLILAVLISLVFVVSPTNAQEANLHIKLEVSLDGTTWYNFSGSEDADNVTLNCSPGDELIVKVTLWNSGDADATNVVGNGTITNSDYIEDATDIDPDADGNLRDFTGYYFVGGGVGFISQIDQGGTYDTDEESMTAVLTLSDDFPAGDTVITATATVENEGGVVVGEDEREADVEDENSEVVSFLKNLLVQKAYAQQGLGRYSRVRIVVTELPATGADLR